jgi:hypothetical protein
MDWLYLNVERIKLAMYAAGIVFLFVLGNYA